MRAIVLSVALLLCTSCVTGRRILTVTNDSAIDRVDEVVEVEVKNPDKYAVYTEEGDILQCQTTYDGKLIFPASVAAESATKYKLKKSRRIPVDTIATGDTYPVWFDDFGWENDKIAFRTYSKTMDKSGGKFHGYDIFTKSYKYPVLDVMYGTQFNRPYQYLRGKSSPLSKGDRGYLLSATTYHVDHGFGMDYYVVGPTLGSGTAALINGDKIYYPDFFRTVEVLDKGGLRLTFRLTFDPVQIGEDMVQEVRTITLDRGTHFNHIEVEYKNLSKTMDLGIGIVMHDKGKVSVMEDNYTAYAEPKHKFGWQTYNAVIYPKADNSEAVYFDKPIGAATGHIFLNGHYTPGTTLKYYMGAGWNRWGFETPEAWFDFVKQQSEAVASPLKCKLK